MIKRKMSKTFHYTLFRSESSTQSELKRDIYFNVYFLSQMLDLTINSGLDVACRVVVIMFKVLSFR